MNPSKIPWTDLTWNIVTGCSHLSAACDGCWAEALSHRYGWTTLPWTAANAAVNVRLHPERLAAPFKRKKPARIFVCAMADLFHERVPDDFLQQAVDVMRACPHLTFQTLTKRPERAAAWPDWPENVWCGVTVEDRKQLHRIDVLRTVPARVRWISFEPLLEDLGRVDLTGYHWAVVGGYSGAGWRDRVMDHAWARGLREQCRRDGLAFYFKQSSGIRDNMNPVLDGVMVREFPELLVREGAV